MLPRARSFSPLRVMLPPPKVWISEPPRMSNGALLGPLVLKREPTLALASERPTKRPDTAMLPLPYWRIEAPFIQVATTPPS